MKNKTTEQTIEELKKTILKLAELQAAQSTLVDIAELEQTIKNLKRKTQEQELLLNTIDTQIWYLTDPETYGLVNQSRADFLGKRREEIEGKRLDDFYSHDVAAVCEVSNAEVFQTRRTVNTEEWFPNAAGELRLISITKIPKLDEHGAVEYVVCAGADVTERKQVEDALCENEQRLNFALEGGAIGMWDWNPKTGRGVWDERTIRMLGYEPNELEPSVHTWKRLVHSDDWGKVSEVLNEHLSGRLPFFEAEYRMRTKSGEYRWFFSRNKVVEYNKDGKPQRITGTIFDVTERRRVEAALKQSEENFRLIVEGAPDAVFVQTGGLFAYLNPAALKLFGANSSDDLLGKPIMDRYHPRFHEITKERIQLVNVERTQVPPLEEIWIRMDGSEVSVDVSAVPIKFLGQDGGLVFARDLTERKETEQEKQTLQAQLIKSQKMEALGTLVGGIAHDFNNMLQVILGYSQLLLGDKKEGEKGYKDLETIIQTSKQGAEMVNKLLAFGQQAPIFPVDLDLNHQIRGLIPLIFRTLPEIVKIDVDLTPGPAMIHADPSQIDQVIMNLAINASEAMPNGGQLNIATTTVSLNNKYCGSYPEVKPGDYVMLLMSDTGRGMDKKTLARVFEPYFSTKQRGSIKGTGLGLSVVQGIVEKQGGHITCESEPGKGSKFRVYLPAKEIGATPQASLSTQSAGTEIILVVEDVHPLAELARRILTDAGYAVIIATNGKEALDIYQTRSNEISLVVLDLIMPEMSGKDCLMELVKIDPSVKVLIASGYDPNDELHNEIDRFVKGFLRKPFEVIQLLEAVGLVLRDDPAKDEITISM